MTDVPSSDTVPVKAAVAGDVATIKASPTDDEKAAESTYNYCYDRSFHFRSKSTAFEVASKEAIEFLSGVVEAALGVSSGHPLAIAKGAVEALGVAKEWVSAFHLSKSKTVERVLQSSLCKDTYVHLLVKHKCVTTDDSVAFISETKGVVHLDGEMKVKVGTNDAAMKEMTELVSKMAREM